MMWRRLLLILRFYRSSMLVFSGTVSVALAWVASANAPSIISWLLLFKLALYPALLYVFIIPLYGDQFFYYRNLGVRRRWLLGGSCAIDFLLCFLLIKIATLL